MTPLEYVDKCKASGFDAQIVNQVLTQKEKELAREVLDAGFGLIGKQLSVIYDDMSPDAVNHAAVLQQFLLVFIEHSMNPSLVRKFERRVNE